MLWSTNRQEDWLHGEHMRELLPPFVAAIACDFVRDQSTTGECPAVLWKTRSLTVVGPGGRE